MFKTKNTYFTMIVDLCALTIQPPHFIIIPTGHVVLKHMSFELCIAFKEEGLA